MDEEEALELLKEERMAINYKVNGTTQLSKAIEVAIRVLEREIKQKQNQLNADFSSLKIRAK